MKSIIISVILIIVLSAKLLNAAQEHHNLKIVTVNVWSGLDYDGIISVGEYEKPQRRKERFEILLKQLKAEDPDVIFIQEANPVGGFSTGLADSLSFDEIHQLCLGGIKIAGLGIPSNLNEGIAILAKPELNLKEKKVFKLAGSFGIYGDVVTLHTDESIFALVGKITVNNSPIYLINVHLTAEPRFNNELMDKIDSLKNNGLLSEENYNETLAKIKKVNGSRLKQTVKLIDELNSLEKDVPFIIGGDFNALPGSPEILLLKEKLDLIDSNLDEEGNNYTWNPLINDNISYSTQYHKTNRVNTNGYKYIESLYDEKPRRIDYIFMSRHFGEKNVLDGKVILDEPQNGLFASDHFGWSATIDLSDVIKNSPKEYRQFMPVTKNEIEALPILSYDTDAGFGYGAKLFLLNQLGMSESFDIVGFNSTNGERWYRLVFSIPDFELRQGKIYPLSFDLIIDYDKWITNSYFGIGNSSVFSAREYYTKEPLEISLTLSKGFTTKTVAQAGVRYKSIKNSNFEKGSILSNLTPVLNRGTAKYISAFANIRYDSRDSYINPANGIVAQGEIEFAPKSKIVNVAFARYAATFQYYSVLFYPTTIFAARLNVTGLYGDNLPVQALLSIGGTNSLRGYPQDRFLDKANMVFNSELRFPIYGRLGAVLGIDAGKVWSSIADIDFKKWAFNPDLGLRFYMDTFVVRFDVGLGPETTGIYFNFGQLF